MCIKQGHTHSFIAEQISHCILYVYLENLQLYEGPKQGQELYAKPQALGSCACRQIRGPCSRPMLTLQPQAV